MGQYLGMTTEHEPTSGSGQSRAAAARLLASVATELARRLVDQPPSETWAEHETPYLQELAQGALSVTLGLGQGGPTCKWDRLPLNPRGDGKWCCVNGDCIP